MVLEYAFQLDQTLLSFLQELHSPLLTEFFLQVTDVGSLTFIALLVAGLVLLDRYDAAILTTVGVIAAGGITYATKYIVGRSRPEVAGQFLTSPISSYAFPSGHATLSFVTATILASRFPQLRWLLYGTAILIALSRLYLGVHFLTDVVAGAVLGVIVGQLIIRYKEIILTYADRFAGRETEQ